MGETLVFVSYREQVETDGLWNRVNIENGLLFPGLVAESKYRLAKWVTASYYGDGWKKVWEPVRVACTPRPLTSRY